MKGKHTKGRLDPLMLLALFVTLAVMMTSTVSAAEESFISNPSFADLEDGDITLAGAERNGAGIHMSFMSPSMLNGNNRAEYVPASQNGLMPDVYLSLRLPW
ncbi:MAG TPA: hypothetical protein VET88_14270 [Gammaproteobacteria bacterium]|nr:hypothetical protein [Gammaproteobacteria bacterium]